MSEQVTAADIELPMVPAALSKAQHIGLDELPYVEIAPGAEVQVLQVDLKQGLWIVRNRFQPGAEIPKHFHTGQVFAVTLEGQWFYKEHPEEINSPGSYLFEPAGSVHTLTVPADQEGPTVVWFAIYGANINMTDDDKVENVIDAGTMIMGYRFLTEMAGQSCEATIVHGED